MSALVRFSIRFHGVVIGLACLIVIYGVYGLTRTNLDVFPEFSPTQVVIQTESPGLSSSLVEQLVTQPIETTLSGTVGVESMRSQSIPGLSIITIIFNDDTDIYRNRQVVAERLATISSQLPKNIIPNIMPLASSASTVLGMGITSDKRTLMEQRTFVDWTIRPHIMAVPGVADVNVLGGDVGQYQILVDPSKLIRYHLSIQEVLAATARVTGVRGAGYIENNNQRILINTEGQAKNISQLGQMPILHQDGQTVRLRDIGQVIEGAAPAISAAAINGKEGVYFSVQSQLGANTKAVTEAVEKAMRELAPEFESQKINFYPALFRPANFIETAIDGVKTDILIGSALVVAVLFLFLFNVRTAFISATAIPLSLLTATIVLGYFGMGLNIMVLGGLAIALGEVVDDAIIDTENIFRRLRENRLLTNPLPAHQVVFNASMEVRSSVVYATIIVVLVFLPLLTLSGVAGKLFAPLGYAYICAIIASLVVALTLTPALCYLLFSRGKLESNDPPLITWMKKGYVGMLKKIERHYIVVISLVAIVITLGLGILPLFKSQFIPSLHEGHYIMHMTAVPGTSARESLRIGKKVAKVVSNIQGVKSVTQWVGRAPNAADTFGTHYSEFEVELNPTSGPEQRHILNRIREELAGEEVDDDNDGVAETGFIGVNFAINTFLTERIEETISGYTAAMVINIHGQDLDALDHDAHQVASVLSNISGASEVQIQSPPGTPELTIRLRPERLALLGLQSLDVLENIQAAYEGVQAAQIYQNNQVTSVNVMFSRAVRDDLREIGKLPLKNPDGKIIYLKDIADISQENGRSKILHAGASRIQTITCNIQNRDIVSFSKEMKARIKSEVHLSPSNF
jgi:CzcA family heavy metal efflux pump